MTTHAARYSALCDALDAFAREVASETDPEIRAIDGQTLAVLHEIRDEFAAKTRKALRPTGYDTSQMLRDVLDAQFMAQFGRAP